MLRCDLRCLLTSSVKELRLAPQCRAPLSSIGRSNMAVIGEQREVARVALRILLPVAMASILSLESTVCGQSGVVGHHRQIANGRGEDQDACRDATQHDGEGHSRRRTDLSNLADRLLHVAIAGN